LTQSTDVFRSMTDEEAEALFREMRDELRPLYKQAERVAADTLRLRPVYLGKQPLPKRSRLMRKALALKPNAESAGEILAAFFLERYGDDLAELLGALGLEHEDGVLKDQAPEAPAKTKLKKVAKEFPQGENALLRGVLLRAFAAQSAIDWPDLDALVFPAEEAKAG
jgi:hypothetical protein